MSPALDALAKLRAGNERFVAGETDVRTLANLERRTELVAGQQPLAIVLGCSDARVPAELIFDQGLGELFSIRVAGNIVAPSQIASIEFAAENFGTRLVVVLGHSQCGAVIATLKHLEAPDRDSGTSIHSIIGRIRPAVQSLLAAQASLGPDALLDAAVRANIRASANHLRHGSPLLEDLQSDGLLILGAEYSLESGHVDFFDGLPAQAS